MNNPIMCSDITGMLGELLLAGVNPTIAGLFLLGLFAYGVYKNGSISVPSFPTSNGLKLDDSSVSQNKIDSKTKKQSVAISGAIASMPSTPIFSEPTPCTTAVVNTKTNKIDRGMRLTEEFSINYVVSGGSVMCDYKYDAEQVAQKSSIKLAGYYSYDYTHGKGEVGEYFEHFHVVGGRTIGRPHIWYIYD